MKKDKAGYQREEHKAEHHFERAVRYHDAKKNGEAIKELTKAISYNPSLSEKVCKWP